MSAAAPLHESPFWWQDAPPEAPPAPDALPASVDVAIVGGGYTGLSAARTLARSGARVVVLEKESIGWGASSRNGGQVLTGLKVGAGTLLHRYGREKARAMFGASLEAIAFLEQLIAEEQIECGYRRCGHVEAAFKPAHFEGLRHDQELLARDFDHEVSLVPRAEQGGELGSDLYHGLLVDERSGALHPARYVRGLAAAARRAGAELWARTPVRELRRESGGFRVTTERGPLAAREVVVATDGYTDAALPAIRRRLVPVGSYIVATAPLEGERAAELLPRARVAFDTKNFLYYFRLSSDQRLLFGGRARFTLATARSTRRAAAILRRGIAQVFPALADVPIDFAWSGNVCFAPDMLPRAGTLGGLHHAVGYAGHGVALATYLGHLTAEAILGREGGRNPFRELPFRAIPFYEGRPWFLPLVGLWYRLKDRIK